MKKKWILLPVVLLLAGLLLGGCPSEPEGLPPKLGNADITFNLNGEYWYMFLEDELGDDFVRIESGNNYEVTIDVEEIDYVLWGCHFQAQLYYELPDGTLYLLAGSKNATPQNIADFGKKYRITLTAGDYGADGDDSEPEDSSAKQEEGGYLIPAVPTTPPGAIQKLRLIVKTPRWYVFGKPWEDQKQNPANAKDNWDVDYYAGEAEGSGLLGTISLRLKPNITYIPGDPVVVNNLDDPQTNKGNIESDEFLKLKNAPEGSILRVFCTANIVPNPSGGNNAKAGWNIAEFGVTFEYKQRGQNIATNVGIPTIFQGVPVPTNDPAFNFYSDILIEDILADAETELVFLNVFNGGAVNNMMIMTPFQLDLPPQILDLLDMFDQLKELDLEKLKEILDRWDEIKDFLDNQ